MITNLSTAHVKCNHCTLFIETNTVHVAKKRGHLASPQTPWKLHDRIEWEYYRYSLAYLLIIICFDDVTPTSQFTSITQLCQAVSLQLRHISTIGKKLVKQQYVLQMSPKYGELQPINGWDWFRSLGHPCKFQLVSRLGSTTARHLVVGVSQTLRHWTEGATYVRQGDHHVGHWPTF